MPDWLHDIILAVVGSASVAAGIGWWFRTRREDRKAEEERKEAVRIALEARVDRLYAKIESLLMDANARERETIGHMQDRIKMDAEQNTVIAAATTALKEATLMLARYKQ